jgi:hypothetical protein
MSKGFLIEADCPCRRFYEEDECDDCPQLELNRQRQRKVGSRFLDDLEM